MFHIMSGAHISLPVVFLSNSAQNHTFSWITVNIGKSRKAGSEADTAHNLTDRKKISNKHSDKQDTIKAGK